MSASTSKPNIPVWSKRLDHMEALVSQFAIRLGLATPDVSDLSAPAQRMDARFAVNGWPEWRHKHFNTFCGLVHQTLNAMRPFFGWASFNKGMAFARERMLHLMQKIAEIQQHVEDMALTYLAPEFWPLDTGLAMAPAPASAANTIRPAGRYLN